MKIKKKESIMKDYNIDEETLYEWFEELDIFVGVTQFEKALDLMN